MLLSRSSLLELDMPSHTLHLHGTTSTAAPTLLTGRIRLHLPQATRIISLELQFQGRLRLHTPDLNRSCDRAVHDVTMTLADKTTLAAGDHILPFEMAVPGSLPASVSTHLGTCEYRLVVRLRRPLFYVSDDVLRRDITLVRHTEEEQSALVARPVCVEGFWGDRASYVAHIPSAAYAKGEHIPVHIVISPLRDNIHVRALDASLVEREVYGGKDPNIGRILSRRSEDIEAAEADLAATGRVERTIWLHVPQPTTLDCDIAGIIRIRHKVEVALRVSDDTCGMARLTMRLPLAILPDPHGVNTDDLPRYQPALSGLSSPAHTDLSTLMDAPPYPFTLRPIPPTYAESTDLVTSSLSALTLGPC